MPTTRTVSARDFRNHMAEFFREAQEKNVHFLVMRHNEPVVHVIPAKKRSKKQASLEKLIADVAEARKDYEEGRVYTLAQARRMLNI